MAERIGVEVTLRGAEAVIAKLREIDALGNKIDKKTYTAHIAAAQTQAANAVRGTTKALTGQANAYRAVSNQTAAAMRNADKMVKALRGMDDVKFGQESIGVLHSAKTAQNEVKRATDAVNRSLEANGLEYRRLGEENKRLAGISKNLNGAQKQGVEAMIEKNIERRKQISAESQALRDDKRSLANYNRELGNEYNRVNQIYSARDKLARAEQRQADELAKRERERAREQVRQQREIQRQEAAQQREAIVRQRELERAQQERINGIKRAYTGFSATFSRLGASMTTLGNTMTRITSPFSSVLRGAAYTIGYGAVNKVTSGLASGFERYDIMKKYTVVMKDFEKGNYTAAKSVEELDMSVRGLPTGLDEIVSTAQRFSTTTGSMKKGTRLAIAANRAFLASMSTDTQRYQGILQLQDVMGGKKMQAREWASLVASMPFAIREMGKSLGYSGKELDNWVSKVQQGKVSNKEFIKALLKAGGEGGSLQKYADYSKDTWEAFSRNVGNAFSRMTAGVLKSFDSITKIATGGKFDSLNKYLSESFIPNIDKTTAKIKGWIKANPDKIISFFDKIKSFDWAGLGRGMVQGIKWTIDKIGKLIDAFGGGDAEKLGRRMVQWNMIGRFISVFGGAIKGLAPLGGILAAVARYLSGKSLSQFLKGLIALRGAKGAVEGAQALGRIGGALKTATLSWQGVVAMGLGIASIPAMAWSLKEAAQALQEFGKVKTTKGLVKKVGASMAAIAAFVAEAAGIGAIVAKLSSNPAGLAFLAGTAIGGFTMAGVSKTMKWLGQGLNAIATAKLPTADKVKAVTKNLTDVIEELANAGETLPPDAVKKAKQFAGLDGIIKTVTSIGEQMPKLAAIKLNKKDIEKATSAVEAMGPAIDAMKTAIASLFGKQTEVTHSTSQGRGKAGQRKTTYKNVFDNKSLESATEATTNMLSMMTNVLEMVDKFAQFKKAMDKMQKLGDVNAISEIGQNIGLMVDEIGHIASRVKTSMGQFGDIEEAPEKFDTLIQVLGKFPKILSSIRKIGEANGEGDNAINMDAIFKPITMGLNRNIDKLIGMTDKIEQFRQIGLKIKMGVDNIKIAFQSLNAPDTYDTSGFTANIANAISQINSTNVDVSGLVNKLKTATNKIKSAWKELMSAYNTIQSKSKSITINVSVNVDAAVANMRRAAARLRAARAELNAAASGGSSDGGMHGYGGHASEAHTGGYINGKGRPIYRAKGGGVLMVPRGTDTVPAMLTPGEYVQRKKAVDYFGVKFMQKINNLDLEGAIRNISTRASRSLSAPISHSVTNNITNKTNNAKVNQTIYTSNPNYTFRRANRYVGAL